MKGREELNIAIVSDLHLSQGRSPLTKRFDRNEDFFFDGKFDRFLLYLEKEASRRSRNWRLIIAGDMVDFLQVTRRPRDSQFELRTSEKRYGLGTSPDKTVWKLKAIMNGHRIFFRALGRFVSSGNKCTMITGNHDIEWTMAEVQKAFVEEIARKYIPGGGGAAKEVVSGQIEFCPWFFYEPGLAWVEHGNQYDGLNSFDYLLFPYLPSSDELMLPGGSFFVRYLFNKVEQKDPFADNIKPVSAYLAKYGLNLVFSKRVMRHVKYFLKVLWKARKFKSEELEELRKKNEEGIEAEAVRFGITIEKLKEIENNWVRCFLYNRGKLRNLWSFIAYKGEESHSKIVETIRKQLDVRYVVFGHTHKADLLPLSSDGKGEYINAGTWTKIFSRNPGESLLREEQESVFVQILRDEGDRLELMRWRDDLGQGERVNLFEEMRPNKGKRVKE